MYRSIFSVVWLPSNEGLTSITPAPVLSNLNLFLAPKYGEEKLGVVTNYGEEGEGYKTGGWGPCKVYPYNKKGGRAE